MTAAGRGAAIGAPPPRARLLLWVRASTAAATVAPRAEVSTAARRGYRGGSGGYRGERAGCFCGGATDIESGGFAAAVGEGMMLLRGGRLVP